MARSGTSPRYRVCQRLEAWKAERDWALQGVALVANVVGLPLKKKRNSPGFAEDFRKIRWPYSKKAFLGMFFFFFFFFFFFRSFGLKQIQETLPLAQEALPSRKAFPAGFCFEYPSTVFFDKRQLWEWLSHLTKIFDWDFWKGFGGTNWLGFCFGICLVVFSLPVFQKRPVLPIFT